MKMLYELDVCETCGSVYSEKHTIPNPGAPNGCPSCLLMRIISSVIVGDNSIDLVRDEIKKMIAGHQGRN